MFVFGFEIMEKAMERVVFQSPQFGGLSIGLNYVDQVGQLFGIDKPAVCVQEKDDEVTEIPLSDVVAGRRYLVVHESELHEGDEKKYSDEPYQVLIKTSF